MLVRRHGCSPTTIVADLSTLFPGLRRSDQRSRAYTTLLDSTFPPKLRHGPSNPFLTIKCTSVDIRSRSLHTAQQLRQSQSDDGSNHERPIAILGGGITGMATAYYIAAAFPNRRITLFDNKDVLGGWIKSNPVNVGDGEVMFESGPRSLRPAAPAGTLTMRLVQELDLIDDFLPTSSSAPAARNRFIYYPDHLVKMPGPGMDLAQLISSLWSEPVFDKIFATIWNDLRTPQRSPELKDESVGSFISRRGHENIANNMVSAVFHGIYAGDVWRLSAKNIISSLWAKEGKQGSLSQSFLEQFISKRKWLFCDDLYLLLQLQRYSWNPKLEAMANGASVYTFKRGIGQLASRLEEWLLANPNVKILKSTEVTKIARNQQDNTVVQVSYQDNVDATPRVSTFSHLVATNPPRSLLPLMDFSKSDGSNKGSVPARLANNLGTIPATTVCVVNLYYRTPKLLQTISPPGGLPSSLGPMGLSGFGYLLPASLPFEQNPERALGVIFDSDISPELYSTVPADKLGTRLTVMLGGHWWDGWAGYPDTHEAQEMALNVLARHLGITEEPAAVNVSLQRDCIPQYHVGHTERMGEAHEALWETFGGRLRVAGSWYTGVGVNDCLRAAWEVVDGIKSDETQTSLSSKRQKRTGLEKFDGDRPMVLVKENSPGTFTILDIDQRGLEQGFLEGVREREPSDPK